MRKEESEPGEVADSARSCVRSAGLTKAEAERVRAMERLGNAPDRATYLALQQEIAEQLKMTVRNVRHLMGGWQAEGVSGVIRQGRSDRGELRLDEEWRDYRSANVSSGESGRTKNEPSAGGGASGGKGGGGWGEQATEPDDSVSGIRERNRGSATTTKKSLNRLARRELNPENP